MFRADIGVETGGKCVADPEANVHMAGYGRCKAATIDIELDLVNCHGSSHIPICFPY